VTFLTTLHAWGRRSLSSRNRAGAWLAMLTCPCHGVLLLYLLAGTAVGSVLFAYRAWMYAGLAAAFVTGLWLLVRPDRPVCPIEPASVRRRVVEHNKPTVEKPS
jgi:hypothetical protein